MKVSQGHIQTEYGSVQTMGAQKNVPKNEEEKNKIAVF